MNFNEFKAHVNAAAKEAGIAEHELYYQTSESTEVSAFKHEINKFSSSFDGGVCFRCLVDGRMGYASTEELSEGSAREIVFRARDNALSLETDEREFLGEGGGEYASTELIERDSPTTEQLIATALAGQDALYGADPAVTDGASTQVVSFRTTVAIANSRGLDLSYENAASLLVSEAVVSDGDEVNTGFEYKCGAFSDLSIGELSTAAVADAKAKLKADVAPTGAYPVIFAPRAFASLLRTFASIFSSEAARKGLSKFADSEGTNVASEMLTIVDDPFCRAGAMPIGFDAEGTPTYRKNVIENGKLNTLLYNLKSAAALGKKTTGNAFKGNYDSPIGIGPFTMYVAPGETTVDELLACAGNGVYIDSLEGLHAGANFVSGDFSLQSGGFMIENGKKTTPVKAFTCAGNFYDLLKNVRAAACDLKIDAMGGTTSFGSPSVLVDGLSIAGK